MTMRAIARSLAPVLARLRAADGRIMADQVAVTGIPAPTGAESDRARWMADRLTESGIRDVHIDVAGNVVGATGAQNGEAPVVLCAHMDTVFESREPIEVRREGIRFEAPGISDNARGLATLVALARELGGESVRTARPVLLAATTGEEGLGDLRGARYLFESAARGAHAAIALDGPGDERIVNTALGSRRYHVAFRGPGGHSWGAYGSPNAVQAAAALVVRLSALAERGRPRVAITPSRISGGETINAIPADAWLEVDIRSGDSGELGRLDRELRFAAVAAADGENAARRPGSAPMSVAVSLIGDRPAGEVPAREAVVAAAVAATQQIGREPVLTLASTDANIPISLGIPAISIGGGGAGGDTHTRSEWFENRDGTRGVARALLTVAALARR
ncbi:MAG TPA: M20/M25/M40 family metallo-hydrolase [Gemmatimonadaceae bacterium]